MLAEDCFREGNLQAALEALQEQIRNHPDNCRYRVFLFQLLTILGQYSRALGQLEVLEKLTPDTWSLVGTYREAIRCEMEREEIFAGRRKPLILGEPPQWVGLLLESLRLITEAQFDAARGLRDQAFDMAAESAGTIDQHAFDWIADADARLGPVMEIILNGRYYWAPFQQIRAIRISAAEDLRDLVWLPAQFTWIHGGEIFGLIPTRYPGSEKTRDAAFQLARKTEWVELSEGVYQGLGQRTLATDQDEYPLLDVRNIVFNR